MANKSNLIQSVDRAMLIIETLKNAKRDMGVSEISRETGLHKSTVFGLISTLEYRNYIMQNEETLKYKLGLKFLEISNEIIENIDINQIIRHV